MTSFFGDPPTQSVVGGGVARPPGFDWAKHFFDYLNQFMGQPMPSYGGNIDPGLSPTMQNLIRMSQGYSGSNAPAIMGNVQGTLGGFMNPSFENPYSRGMYGSPNYFPQDPNTQTYGGNSYGSLYSQGGGQYGGGQQGDQGTQFGGQSDFSGSSAPPWLQDLNSSYGQQGGQGGPPQGGEGQGGHGGDFWGGLQQMMSQMQGGQDNSQQAPAQSQTPADFMQGWDKAYGVKTAHNMGAGANVGQLRTNPATGQQEIYTGTGKGGESYDWTAFNPNDYGQAGQAHMFNRYGANWNSGGGAGTGMHSSDIAGKFQETFGRAPTQQETQDYMYGVKPMSDFSKLNWGSPTPNPGGPQPAVPGTNPIGSAPQPAVPGTNPIGVVPVAPATPGTGPVGKIPPTPPRPKTSPPGGAAPPTGWHLEWHGKPPKQIMVPNRPGGSTPPSSGFKPRPRNKPRGQSSLTAQLQPGAGAVTGAVTPPVTPPAQNTADPFRSPNDPMGSRR